MMKYTLFLLGVLLAASAHAQQVPHPVGGPATSTMDELTSWNSVGGNLLKQGTAFITNNNSTAPITAEGSPLTARNTTAFTAQQISDAAFLQVPGAALPIYDGGLRGVAFAPASSTVNIVSGISSYMISDAVTAGSGFPAAAGLFTSVVARGNGAKVWGINTLMSDTTTGAVSAGTGKALNNEFDFNVSSPNTTVLGLQFAGSSKAQPASAYGVVLQPLDLPNFGTVSRWTAFLQSNAGATNTFAGIGAKQNTGTSIKSQDLVFAFKKSTGVDGTAVMTASEAGGIEVFATDALTRAVSITGGGGRFAVQDTGGFSINERTVLQGNLAVFSVGADAGYTTQNYSNAAAQTTIFGSLITLTPAGGSAVSIGAGRLQLPTSTVGALTGGAACSAGTRGSLIWVTDANSAVFNAIAVGGGSNIMMVGCDGTNWRVR